MFRKTSDIHRIIIHHTATSETATPTYLEDVHIQVRQFSMIGYHFLIAKNGDVYEGRPLHYQGAHVLGHNSDSIGIALIGNFNVQYPSFEQLVSLAALSRQLKATFKIQKVSFHKHFNASTDCPGRSLSFIMHLIPI